MVLLTIAPSSGIKKTLSQKLSPILFEIDTLPLCWHKNDKELEKFLDVYIENTEKVVYGMTDKAIKSMYNFFYPHKEVVLEYIKKLNPKKDEHFTLQVEQVLFDNNKEEYISKNYPISLASSLEDIVLDKDFFCALELAKKYDFNGKKLLDYMVNKKRKTSILSSYNLFGKKIEDVGEKKLFSILVSLREIYFLAYKELYITIKTKDQEETKYFYESVNIKEWLNDCVKPFDRTVMKKRMKHGSCCSFKSVRAM
ncbi:MAG TPA: hypothetical protein EYP33_02175 [Pyrodictium sp.]|nr:hypothetical protein [Pyrodictium sp.]